VNPIDQYFNAIGARSHNRYPKRSDALEGMPRGAARIRSIANADRWGVVDQANEASEAALLIFLGVDYGPPALRQSSIAPYRPDCHWCSAPARLRRSTAA
jgi:hypothetical protein